MGTARGLGSARGGGNQASTDATSGPDGRFWKKAGALSKQACTKVFPTHLATHTHICTQTHRHTHTCTHTGTHTGTRTGTHTCTGI